MSEDIESTGMALDMWDIVAVVIYFGLIMGVGLLVSQFKNGIFRLSEFAHLISVKSPSFNL